MSARAATADELVVLRKDANGRTVGRARVVVRPDEASDILGLLSLADRAGAPVPAGPLLVTEVDGVVRAAAGIGGSGTLADPTIPSSLLLELLAERLERERLSPSARRLRRWRERLGRWERLWAAARPGDRELRRLDAVRSGFGPAATRRAA